jgi:hypothetical protein
VTENEKKIVAEIVESEGFAYGFLSYSDFREINDLKFHELRKGFVDAAKALAHYCGVETLD